MEAFRKPGFHAYCWVVAGASFVIAVGAWAPWGALSLVAEQREATVWTRVIVSGLAAVAALACWRVPMAFGYPLAALLFAGTLFLGYGEWRYEANQALQYDVVGSRAGLLMVLLGSFVGLIVALAGVIAARRERHGRPATTPPGETRSLEGTPPQDPRR